MAERGVVAAGHPLTAQAGADVLRAGGNAVDAALAALMTSFMAEPLLTGLGAGGYMLVAPPGGEPVLLDFMVAAPGHGERAPLDAVVIDFGDAVQVFHIGASSCGVYGVPAGIAEAAARFGSMPLSELAAPAIALARDGHRGQPPRRRCCGTCWRRSRSRRRSRARATASTAACRARATIVRDPDLADGIERLARDGAAPFYTGDIGAAVSDWVVARGGTLTRADLAAYATVPREPVRVRYHGREVLTNPPPSAGGLLIAYALALLERGAGAARRGGDRGRDGGRAGRAHARRSSSTSSEPGFLQRSWPRGSARRPTSRVLDADGWACAVTTTNGEGSGIVVPGTGIHVNNMMGEQDLSPAGWFTHPPGPPAAVDDGADRGARRGLARARARLAPARTASARAILQVIVNAIDHGMEAQAAVDAPRLHFEDGLVYAEPGIDGAALEAAGRDARLVPRAQPVLRRLPGRRAPPRDARVQRRGRSASRRRGRARVTLTTCDM